MGGNRAGIGWQWAGPGSQLEVGSNFARRRCSLRQAGSWKWVGLGAGGNRRPWGVNTGTWDGRWGHGCSSGTCRNGAVEWVDMGGTRLVAGSRWEWAGNGRIGHGQALALMCRHCRDRRRGGSVRKWAEWADMGGTGLVAGGGWEWVGNRWE